MCLCLCVFVHAYARERVCVCVGGGVEGEGGDLPEQASLDFATECPLVLLVEHKNYFISHCLRWHPGVDLLSESRVHKNLVSSFPVLSSALTSLSAFTSSRKFSSVPVLMTICCSLTVVLHFRFCPQQVAICGVLWPVSVSDKQCNTILPPLLLL